uniref:Heavy-metal-associated domain-containing protein n=1 Tax=Candidatus Kentrum sp. UNK TaxID=2126344 RepID=A0A451AYK6_9GAMM|nr:MAG: hypothetical protein BECKUNK1418G_GA0071005_104726 [Candidatus Kentron sp. UNK]VFK71126.1 MAG: hypothetical protein BECKUNK1418H_GA0071006_105126 [Candidatus Kentron sp. UNK]
MQYTDVLIHVNELLDNHQKDSLESELRNVEGVVALRFNKPHLLLISYDPEKTDASRLLGVVKSGGCEAQLVGL